MPPAAILDIDGTLVDTNYHHALAWYRAFRAHGELCRCGGSTGTSAWAATSWSRRSAARRWRREKGDDIRAAEKERYGELIGEVEPLRGRARADREAARSAATRSCWPARPSRTRSTTTSTCSTPASWSTPGPTPATWRRPSPSPISSHAAIEKAGGGEAVMVGDSTWDCEAAGRAGIETVAVLTGGFSEAELREAGAAIVFESIEELRERVRETPLRMAKRLEDLPRQARLRARRPSRAAAKAPARPRAASSSRSTTPAACTGTCASSTTACSSPGPCRAGSRSTRTRTASPCTPRTTRSSTSTSRGEIPEGEYGAGTMKIWDRGTYEAEKFRDDEVIATFHGERVHGRYVLFPTRGKNWMIHRMDPPEDPSYEPMPDRIEPMLARSGEPAARRGEVGLRDQVGRRPRDRLRRRRAHHAPEPQPHRHHAALPGAARARPRARRPAA